MIKFRSHQIFLLTFFYVGILPLLYGIRCKVIAPTFLFAGDAFYYLDIARNSRGVSGFSFDHTRITNGFHPLWEYVLVGFSKLGIADYTQHAAALLSVYYLNLFLLALGAACFSVVAARLLQRQYLALLVAAPGLFWIFAGLISQGYLSTWSYLNGMESALALLCFSVAMLLYRDEEKVSSRRLVMSIFFGLAILARLDDVFLVGAIAVFLVLRTPPTNRRSCIVQLSPIAIMLAAYLAYNWTSAGVLLPLSGATKAGFALKQNGKDLVKLFLPTGIRNPATLLTNAPSYSIFVELGARMVQMVLPPLVCAAELFITLRRKLLQPRFGIVHALAIGIILKAAYNFVFVQVWNQGMWYYTVSIAVTNLIMVLWLDRAVAKWRVHSGLKPIRPWILFSAHALGVLLAFNIFISTRSFDGPKEEVALLEDNSAVRRKLQTSGADKIIEFDDGFISYVSDLPSAAALGLALDREAATALKHGALLPLLYQRGYRIAVAHKDYARALDQSIAEVAQGKRSQLWAIHGSEFNSYTLRPLGGDGSADRLSYYELVPTKP